MAKMIQIGQLILGRYLADDYLAEGGQVSVVKAFDQQTGAWVVVKQLHESPGDSGYATARARFDRMAQIKLGHPNVVDPTDSGEEDGEQYVIMPFYDGGTLTNLIDARGGRLSAKEAAFITVEIANGLDMIHQNGIVHRDIKPDNILITPDNRVLVTDLGICHVTYQQTLTEGSDLLGSVMWMAPEQIQSSGQIGYRTDIYSLGVMLYVMLTGYAPTQGNDSGAVLLSICQHVPPAPKTLDPSIPDHIDQACMRLLVKQPEGRLQSAQEFIQAIQGGPQPAGGCFCPSCGVTVEPNARFCAACGAGLNGNGTQCLACGSPVNGFPVCPGCNRPFSPRRHRLQFTKGLLTGVTFLIPEGIFNVGRDELASRDHHISRRHFAAACLNGTVFIQDIGSTNKTYVEGQPAITPTSLVPNQQIVVAGNTAIYTNN